MSNPMDRGAAAAPARRVSAPPATGGDAALSHELRDAIARLEAELAAQHNLAVLGGVTAMVAHEFNNLLTPILARAEAAANDNDIESMRAALRKIHANAQRATDVATHLMGMLSAEPDTSATCGIADAVDEAVELLGRSLARAGLQLVVTVPGELRARCNRDLLAQVVLNLLLNARDAMQGDRTVVSIRARRDGDWAEIDVSDTGRGLTREQIDTVFNPFLATRFDERPADWHEVGLGLNVCRTIAQRHGATIRVLPNDGPGCTFRLRWPAG